MKTKKTKSEIEKILRDNIGTHTFEELGKLVGLKAETVKKRCYALGLKRNEAKTMPTDMELIEKDLATAKAKIQKKDVTYKYSVLLRENETLKKKLEVLDAPRDYSLNKIIPIEHSVKSEATAVVLASDWHMEQLVDGRRLSYPNQYNLKIAQERAEEFFRAVVRLVKKEQTHQDINTLVLALLGDFITGNIHMSELPNLQLGIAESCFLVEESLIKGIQYILDNTDVKIICPAVVGNHSRITEKVWLSSEQDNSVETIIYYHVKQHFAKEQRFELIMPYGPETFMDIYGMTIAFCHGHLGFRYGGGVGGLYVPIRRTIMRKYNKRQIYMVCMGHFHSYIQDPLFMVNGSMIGYDDYANAYGLDFDIPKQTFFLIDKKRQCRTVTVPIVFKQ
jgi:hypothetical protein